MNFAMFFILLIVIFVFLILFNSYFFQLFIKKYSSKKFFVENFKESVKGKFYSQGYYNTNFEFLSSYEYNKLKKRSKIDYAKCYNVVSFKTTDSIWELFFILERDGIDFKEKLIIRSFPSNMRIKSEGTIERSISRLNIYSNNRYLSGVIESSELSGLFDSILNKNSDNIHIYNNNLTCSLLYSKDISVDFILDVIHKLNIAKNRIYKRGIMEY